MLILKVSSESGCGSDNTHFEKQSQFETRIGNTFLQISCLLTKVYGLFSTYMYAQVQ